MEIKPDYRFTKLHTKKGSVYTLEIYIGIEESFVGRGSTMAEAVENSYKKCSLRIKELDDFMSMFYNKFANVNAIDMKNKIDEKAIADGKTKLCKYCKTPLTGKKQTFCSDRCRWNYNSAHKKK